MRKGIWCTAIQCIVSVESCSRYAETVPRAHCGHQALTDRLGFLLQDPFAKKAYDKCPHRLGGLVICIIASCWKSIPRSVRLVGTSCRQGMSIGPLIDLIRGETRTSRTLAMSRQLIGTSGSESRRIYTALSPPSSSFCFAVRVGTENCS